MHKYFFLKFLFLLIVCTPAFSQNNTGTWLKGYPEASYYKYFDSVHILNKPIINQLDKSYYCYVVFKVDRDANIADFDFIEVPGVPVSDLVKSYIKLLFVTTNGKWERSVAENRRGMADDLLFSVSLLKNNETIDERLKVSDKLFEFEISGLSKQKRLTGCTLLNEKSITLRF